MKNITLLNFIFIILLLTGCNSDPTDVAKTIIEQKISTQSNGALKLKDFSKVNATSQEVFGVNLYEVEYTVTVEVIKDGGWVFLDNEVPPKLWGYSVRDVFQKNDTNHQLKMGEEFTPWNNGVNPKITLKKTENGWVEN